MSTLTPTHYRTWRTEATGRDRAYASGYRAGWRDAHEHHRGLVTLGIVGAILIFGRRIHPLFGLTIALLILVTLSPLLVALVVVELAIRHLRQLGTLSAVALLATALSGMWIVAPSAAAATPHGLQPLTLGATPGGGSVTVAPFPSGPPPIPGEGPDPDQQVPGGPHPNIAGSVNDTNEFSNWSGRIDLGTTFTAVIGYWTVPSVVPSTSPKYAANWIGIGGTTGGQYLIQTGTTSDTSGDTTSYFPWVELLPAAPVAIDEPVSPGDEMGAEIDEVSTNRWDIIIEDVTKDWGREYKTVTYTAGQRSSAEWITERPLVDGSLSTLANFTSARFHDIRRAGTDLTAVTLRTAEMVDRTGQVIAYAGPLYAPTTGDFTDYYVAPPTVTSVSPSQGPTTGGTSVTITGTYFITTTLVQSVHFGADAAPFSVNSNGTITATSPTESAGTVNTTVTTTDGTSPISSADQFTYVAPPPPSVTGLSPSSGTTSGGTSVTISGTNFAGATAVHFGTASVSFGVDSSDTITASSPAHAAGAATVTVTTANGTSRISSADQFTYVAPPPPTPTPTPAPTSTNTTGYRMVAGDGGVFDFGTAQFYGSMGGKPLNKPVVASAATPTGGGYWEVAGDGGIFSFGNAQFHGSMGGTPLNKPVVAMAADPGTGGYWEVASDGGIFSFDAPFYGSMGGKPLNKPIVGMAATPTGGGYWLVASDGGIFSFGNAQFHGSMGGKPLNAPIVGMTTDTATGGYWFTSSTGGVFSFDAPFHGSATGSADSPVVGMAASATGNGYWIGDATGQVFAEGVPSDGTMTGKPLNQPMVGFAVS